MTERKKKPRSDDNISAPSTNNFTNFFLALCEKYDVDPLPKIVPVGVAAVAPETSRQKLTIIESTAPIIHVYHENPKSLETIEKIECKGYEISVCILDALGTSIKKFDTITTIRLPNCGINAYGITQIAQILTDVGCVKDLNLDLNPNIRENYHLLCTPLARLQYLSLKYCNISDAGVEKIANELRYNGTKESQLIGLNLANNCIGDNGAGQIGHMLRTNRSLQSVILTGNRIGDFGAALIIQELCINSLTHEEIVELRRLNYSRLMQRQSQSLDCISDFSSQERFGKNLSSKVKPKTSRRSVSSRKITNFKRSVTSNGSKLATIKKNCGETDSTNSHPLSLDSRPIEGKILARGNFELQHLNLSYNHLTDESLKKFVKCLFYQNYMLHGDASKGLIHVYLEGNDFQIEENENWNEFHQSLALRRSSQPSDDNLHNYENFVSAESQILREKLEASR